MKKLIYCLLCLFVTFATFAQTDTTKLDTKLSEFPGGKDELAKFLSDNIKVPSVVRKKSLNGRSIVKIVIGADGYVSSATIVEPMEDCPECDEEVVRVVKMMPQWTPAKHKGNLVPSYYLLPISFDSTP